MEENEYRSIYHTINQQRCLFEKTILSRRANCQHAHRFNLADREGVACQQQQAAVLCKTLLEQLRNKALFALKLPRLEGPLPHAKEIKVQTGGLYGVRQLLGEGDDTTPIADIIALLHAVLARYGDVQSLPYPEITRSIVHFEGRSRRDKR
jgi:hypothetical protein